MKRRFLVLACILGLGASAGAGATGPETSRDILVTFENHGARPLSGGFGAPFHNRARYAISTAARRDAAAIEAEYTLVAIDQWPIRSLSVFCVVYRIPAHLDRDTVVARLNADRRVESAQPLQRFRTAADPVGAYNDQYAGLQYGLSAMGIAAAHRYSRGANVRVAVVDAMVDTGHEDLEGRIARSEIFTDAHSEPMAEHGTAIASLIAANANNATGIVGVAPGAIIEMFVACWREEGSSKAVCDSFTLAKALDAVLEDPPEIVNLSLIGPYDPLLARLLERAHRAGVILIAASSAGARPDANFPASMDAVIGVASSNPQPRVMPASFRGSGTDEIFAFGTQIMVALPNDEYDFRSGSSLAAAQVSGIAALLLSVSPRLSSEAVRALLDGSQDRTSGSPIVNACMALYLDDQSRVCR